jgi:7-carboxy-7-deazaguanine synthase
MARASLRVREIYRSIQGESTFAGWPCGFVRTAGCDIRCVYCDEAQAFTGGERLSLDELEERVAELRVPLLEITGGEPLAQRATPDFVSRLLERGYAVLVETGGHHDVSVLDPRCHVILDVKTPGSGMSEQTDLENLGRVGDGDEVKFVLTGRSDYEWARDLVRDRAIDEKLPVHFSPVHGLLDPRDLADWILEDGLRVRLNLQLHKYIWGADAKGV